MNPHAARSISPFALLSTLKSHRNLIYNLIKREVIGRYRGSVMGLFWSFFNPVLMLVVYTFVFSVVFKARWAGGTDSRSEFALVLFAGLMVYNLFSECINRLGFSAKFDTHHTRTIECIAAVSLYGQSDAKHSHND